MFGAMVGAWGWRVGICEEKKNLREPQKATAEQLIFDADRALAFLAKALKESPDHALDSRNARQQPFWSALKRAGETLEAIKAQLFARDPKFFETLNDGTQIASELRSLFPRSGIKSARVEEGVKALSNALLLLRKNYGHESLRRKRGGELSAAEKLDFSKLKDALKELAENLTELETQTHGNRQLSTELKRLLAQIKTGIDAPMTLDALERARETLDVIEGEWSAYSYYVEPKFRQTWKDSKTGAALTAMEKANVWSDVELDSGWEQLDESMFVAGALDIPADLTPAEIADYRRYLETLAAIELEEYYALVLDAMEEEAYEEMQMEQEDAQQNSEGQ